MARDEISIYTLARSEFFENLFLNLGMKKKKRNKRKKKQNEIKERGKFSSAKVKKMIDQKSYEPVISKIGNKDE